MKRDNHLISRTLLAVGVAMFEVSLYTLPAHATGQTVEVENESKLSALSEVKRRILACSQNKQFYTAAGCQSINITGMNTDPPKPAGLAVTITGGKKYLNWYQGNSCDHGTFTCHFSCPKTAWLEVVNSRVQPYYCVAPVDLESDSTTCANIDLYRSGRTTLGNGDPLVQICASKVPAGYFGVKYVSTVYVPPTDPTVTVVQSTDYPPVYSNHFVNGSR